MLLWVLGYSQRCWGALRGVGCSQGCWGLSEMFRGSQRCQGPRCTSILETARPTLNAEQPRAARLVAASLSQESPISSLGPRIRPEPPQHGLSCSLRIQLMVGGLAAPGRRSLSACSGAEQLALTAPDPAVSRPLLGRPASSTYHPHVTSRGCLCPGQWPSAKV